MGRPALDLTGQVFTRLTVVEKLPSPSIRTGTYWLCICECGKEVKAYAHGLKSGGTKSCGCYIKEMVKQRNTKHGDYKHPAYRAWLRIKQRCYDKNASNYPRYGGRGIKMHKAWVNDYELFKSYIMKLPNFPAQKGTAYTINRIDNNGDYEPENINFVLKKNQTRNREKTLFLRIEGKDIPLAKFAEKQGLPYWKIWRKYKDVAYTRSGIFV